MNSFQDLFDRQKLHFARGATRRPPERAGVRQEECGDIHHVDKRGLSVCSKPQYPDMGMSQHP